MQLAIIVVIFLFLKVYELYSEKIIQSKRIHSCIIYNCLLIIFFFSITYNDARNILVIFPISLRRRGSTGHDVVLSGGRLT